MPFLDDLLARSGHCMRTHQTLAEPLVMFPNEYYPFIWWLSFRIALKHGHSAGPFSVANATAKVVGPRARGGIVLSVHVYAGKYDNYDVFTC